MQTFLLVYYGNTGSSWLIQTLGSAPAVFVPAFEPLEKWAWDVSDSERLEWIRLVFSPPGDRSGPVYEEWLARLAENPHFSAPQRLGFSMVGFKMHAHAIDDRMALLQPLQELGSRVILLQRRNRIKHALSLYRYHEESKSQFDKQGVRPPSEVDLSVFHRWVRESVVLQRQSEVFWAKAVAVLGRDSLARVEYEDFIDEPGKVATMERLAGFIGIEEFSYTASPLRKATSDSLSEAVVNYPALAERYAGTEFAQFLAD